KHFASSSDDGTFKIWRIGETKSLKTIRGHGERDELTSSSASVGSVVFAPNGRSVASSGSDQTIKLWDVAAGRLLRAIKMDSPEGATALAFAPDGRTLIGGDINGGIKYWDVATGQVTRSIEPANPYNSILFAPSGSTAATQDSDQLVRLWDVNS